MIKHRSLARSREDVERWFKKATEEIFLWDSYPKDNQEEPQPKSIRERYVDQEDVNCPIALVLGRFEEFEDTHVKDDPPGDYITIDDATELDEIMGDWTDPGFDVIMVEEIYNALGYSDHGGYGKAGWYIWMGTNHASVVKTLAHEFGHYRGSLPDTYLCDPNQNGCGRNWLGCTCFCGNCNQIRRLCKCHPDVQLLPELVNDPACPNNFMGIEDEHAVLPAQRDKLK